MLLKYFNAKKKRPSQGFWGTGETGHLFQGNKGQIMRGTGKQRQYRGTGNIRKQIFDFWGTGERANLFQGNKETGTPWEGLKNRFMKQQSCRFESTRKASAS